MKMSNVINLTTNEKMRNYAKVYSTLINNEFQRKRAYASLMALYSLCSYMEDNNLLNVQKSMTVFRTPELNEKFEITDFYINNWHIDVRVTTDYANVIIPKSHYEYDILPDFYAVIKADKDLSQFELLGFADASSIEKTDLDKDYYSIDCNHLCDYNGFIEKIKIEKSIEFNDSDHEFFKESYLCLIDDNAEKDVTKKVLKHIFACPECRAEFCCFCGFEMVSKNVQNYPDIFNDDMLNIVGAQAVDDDKYAGKEETIYIGADDETTNTNSSENVPESEQTDSNNTLVDYENIQEYKDDTIPAKNTDENVSEILDELFNIENEDNNQEQESLKPKEQEEPTEQPIKRAKPPVRIQYIGMDDEPEPEQKTEPEPEINEIEQTQKDEQKTDEQKTDEQNGDNIQIEEYPEDIIDSEIEEYHSDNISLNEQVSSDIVEFNDDTPVYDDYNDNYTEAIDDDTFDMTYETDESDGNAVDKVIVDYDEIGNPIYSYINKAESQNDDLNLTDDNDNSQNDSNIEEYQEDAPLEVDGDVPEYENNDMISDDILAYNDDDENEEDTSEANTEKEYKVYNTDFDNESGEDENIQKFDDENEDNDEDDDDSDDIAENTNKSSKTGLMIALALIILAIPTAFLTMKTIKNANSTLTNQEEIDVPSLSQIDDLFASSENASSLDDLITPAGDVQNLKTDENSIKEKEPLPSEKIKNKEAVTVKDKDDLNHVIASALKESNNKPISVSGVNWQCAPELFTNKDFKQFLQQSDKILKMNLNKNILDATEQINNHNIKIRIELDKKGNLIKSDVEQSSGSKQIDDIVLQSIKETMELQKSQLANNSAQHKDNYVLKVVIKL